MANSQTFTLNIKALFDASDVKTKVGDIQRAFSNIKMPDKLQKDFNASFSGLEKALTDFESRTAKGVNSKADAKGMSQSIDAVVREFNKVIDVTDRVKAELGDTVDLSKIIKLDKSDADALKTLKDNAAQLKKEITNFDTKKITDVQKAFDEIGKGKLKEGATKAFEAFKNGDIDEALKQLDQLIAKYDAMSTRGALANNSGFKDNLQNLHEMRDAIANVSPKVQELEDNYKQQAQIAQNAFNKTTQQINNEATALKNLAGAAQGANQPIKELSNNQSQFVKEIDQVKSRIQYFFGLSNAINLVKRAIRGAFDTIKELDKAMTETAVVTDFSVGDMWKQLPEYTKRANELGVSTLAAYQAATLYYQQGLKTEEVNALSVETLKMARIAGLDAADATDRMTNALRGFNMQLTEANAQRVDDVYSELAANTASNVDEISTAMTKVASLAHNANMEFETTAAFLSQIIETTRESAETAGTALKTVVARFSEVKKLIDTNQLQGQDEEGQVVDVNRVGQALRTAGIDLNKYFLGEVGLDDIFIELASKWDTLTSVQQRYIATQAAGSRQQSRFIALMSDYARTQELVGKAYNANGASARQFAKTQESLESKLARLKNAWNEFLMGLTNNNVVKGFIDLLTNLLNGVNKLTSAFGESGSAIAKWGIALGTILGGKALISSGGPLDNLIGLLTSGTVVGAALGKNGIGGKFNNVENAETKPIGVLQGIINQRKEIKAQRLAAEQNIGQTWYLNPNLLNAKENYRNNPTQANLDNVSKAIADAQKQAQDELKQVPKGLFGSIGQNFKDNTLIGKQIAKWMGPAASGASVLGVALGGVAAAVGLVVAGYQAWLRLTPEGHLKQATAIADALNKTAANAQKAAKSMRNAYDEYNNYDEAVSKASTSAEKQRKIQERTEYISQMMQENPALAQYISSSQEGGEFVLTINEQSFKNAVEEAEKGAITASANAAFADALKAGAQADVYEARRQRSGIDLNTRTQTSTVGDEIVTRELTDKEFTKYSNEAVLEAQARRNAQQYAKQGYLQLMSGMDLEDDIANILADGLAAGFDQNKELTKINKKRSENWWSGEATKEQLRVSYKELYGSDADSSMGRKELAQAVAEAQVNQEKQNTTQELANMLSGVQGDLYKEILQAQAGQGEKIGELASDEEVENYLNDIFDKLDNDKLLAFAKTLEIDTDSVDEAREAIIKKTKVQRNDLEVAKKQQKANVFENLLKQGLPANLLNSVINNINGMTQDQIIALESTLTNAEQILSPEKFQEALPKLTDLITSDSDVFEEVQNLFGSINLDDPINAFNKLKAAEDNASAGVKEYINLIRDSNADIFTAGNLVQSFIASADYDGLTKQMDKLIKKNEHLSAKNIEEMAEECDKLNDLLETGAADAQTLAEAFTLVQQGELAFDQITDSILAALAAGTSFEELITKVGDWISEFDKGTDLKEGTKHIEEIGNEFRELIDNWEFGNEPTEKIYDHLFGKGAYKKKLDQFITDTEADFEGLEKELTGDIDKIITYSANEGLEGIRHAAADDTKVRGLEQIGENIFKWDLSDYKSTQEAINEVANSLGVTEEAALAFIEAWQTHTPKLREEWNELDYKTKLAEFAANLIDTTVVTDQQLAALAALTGKSVGQVKKELDDAIKKVNETREAAGKEPITIPIQVNWQDSDGKAKTGKELDNEIQKVIGTYQNYVNNNSERRQYGRKTQQFVDYNKFRKDMDAAKVSDEQRKEIAKSLHEQTGALFQKEIEVPISFEDGVLKTEIKKISGESEEALQAAEEYALKQADYDLIAKGIAGIELDEFQSHIESAASSGMESGLNSGWSSFAAVPHELDVPVNLIPKTTVATGGIVKSYAKGSENFHVGPGVALTGEEGPEIIWNKEKGYAYVTGENGAEFQNLQPGDRVFNAPETKRIFKNSSLAKGGYVDSFAAGGWKNKGKGKGSGSGSGSGSGDDKDNEWKNDLDWLYNVMENIAELERQQNIYQEEYEDLLKDQTKTGQDLYKMLIKQLGNLYAQLDHQTYTLERREQEMREFMDTTNDKDEYLWYNWEDRTIEIDWDAIDKITDQEEYDHIKDLISEAEEIQDKMDDAEDAIIDVENQIQELENIWRDTFTEFEDRVLDAIVKMYQAVIDNYSELNDTLNESNQTILDSIQKEISLQRQIRDNTKTEQEIADNEAKLAYMQRDTTGGNVLETLQMGKDLDDQRQDYQDNLIDQAIQKLQDDNDAAAQQREKQIEIMQAQLDYQAENGEFNAYIRELMETAISSDGQLATDSDLYHLLAEQENLDAMTKVQRDVWEEELNGTFKEVAAFLLKEQGEAEGSYFTAVTAAFNGISDTFEKAFHGSYSQGGAHGGSSSSGSSGGEKKKTKGKDDPPEDPPKTNTNVTISRNLSDYDTYLSPLNSVKKIDEKKVTYELKKIQVVTPTIKNKFTGGGAGHSFATGGLADYTGLAWLDGTPSEPEYVLNARQTDAFLKLADVLPTAMSPQNSGNSTIFGDTTNNIVINVDRIDSDYSVDQMVDRVKEKLFETGSYRNNNVLSLLR